jgi:Ankyrin repeats (3 copies)
MQNMYLPENSHITITRFPMLRVLALALLGMFVCYQTLLAAELHAACPVIDAINPSSVVQPTPALLQAVADRNYAKTLALLKHGVSVDSRGIDGGTPLMSIMTVYIPEPMESARRAAKAQAAKDIRDIPRFTDLLLKYNADINAEDRNGNTVLITAVIYHKNTPLGAKMVKRLLAAGAKVDHKNAYGMTALMFAADSGDQTIAGTLISHGAQRAGKDCRSETAADKAHAKGFIKLAKLLGLQVK